MATASDLGIGFLFSRVYAADPSEKNVIQCIEINIDTDGTERSSTVVEALPILPNGYSAIDPIGSFVSRDLILAFPYTVTYNIIWATGTSYLGVTPDPEKYVQILESANSSDLIQTITPQTFVSTFTTQNGRTSQFATQTVTFTVDKLGDFTMTFKGYKPATGQWGNFTAGVWTQ